MGRNSGYIAVNSGIAGGAVAIICPELDTPFDELYDLLVAGGKTTKKSNLVVVAEGSKIGGANELAKKIQERSDYFDIKVTILGHLQRGCSPTYFDRVLASRMAVAAVEGLLEGRTNVMVGIKDNKVVYNTVDVILSSHHEIDQEALRISKILSI
jgi:6-phosphofructokinase 1